MSDDLTTQERIMLYDAHKERDELRARLADTERQLREAQERCERLEGVMREVRGDYADALRNYDMVRFRAEPHSVAEFHRNKVKQRLERIDAALSEPGEMTQAMQEGEV